MNVKELIAQLEKYDPELPVCLSHDAMEESNYALRSVILNRSKWYDLLKSPHSASPTEQGQHVLIQ